MKNTAILLLSCPDMKGIVATVSSFLYKHNANIVRSDEHQDGEEKLFFLRTEWNLDDFKLNKQKFNREFSKIAKDFNMNWRTAYSEEKQNVAICLSKEEHCLTDLLYRHQSGEINCAIKCIIGTNSNGKKIAEFYGIPFYEIEVNKNKIKAEKHILALIKKYKVDLIVLARYMRILSPDFLQKFKNPIINIHHSFLPAFIGTKPYHQAYERGVKIIGATAHYVTAELDQGPIIEQDITRVSHKDNIAALIQKGRDIEKLVLSRAVKSHLENRVLIYGNKTIVFD